MLASFKNGSFTYCLLCCFCCCGCSSCYRCFVSSAFIELHIRTHSLHKTNYIFAPSIDWFCNKICSFSAAVFSRSSSLSLFAFFNCCYFISQLQFCEFLVLVSHLFIVFDLCFVLMTFNLNFLKKYLFSA